MLSPRPNLIYIGPDKSGSTWLSQALAIHPQIHVTPAKDIYFFDRYYHRGFDWYRRQFRGHGCEAYLAEVSHDYLYSETAAQRIQHDLPDVQLIVCLREPVQRAFSGYLHLIRTGIFQGSFLDAVQAHPGLIARGCYGTCLRRYLTYFPLDRIHVLLFDDLQRDPSDFARSIYRRLDVSEIPLPDSLRDKVLPAGRSRSILLTRAVRYLANRVRDAGLPGLVGRAKSSRAVRRLLYRQYEGLSLARWQLSPQDEAKLKPLFFTEVRQIDQLVGTTLIDRWNYRATVMSRDSKRPISC